ncbi:MAG: PhnD/SsuA/transferrin family substrate-binding protein [Rhodospirillales bacterium]|nr:PhnD/SsuA/transferrin family substrate-binding protein [Rhodospirillales bacterium]
MHSDNQYAALGMYDFSALRPAQDTWWVGLAGHFRELGLSGVPSALNRSVSDPYDIWQSPNLFFAQTCGYPLTHRLAGKVQLLGTPCYDALGCEGASYRSLFVVRSDTTAENLAALLPARIAVNGKDSYSGWQVLRGRVDPECEIIISGSHASSIDLVRDGRADIAAIDCVTHALIGDGGPERLAGTRIIEQSPLAPGLPYITRADMDEPKIRTMIEAIGNAFDDPQLVEARMKIRLAGFKLVPLSQYMQAMN